MVKKRILVEDVAKEWLKNPDFVREYEALSDEFGLANALISARSPANMTQEDVTSATAATQAGKPRAKS